MIVGAAFICHGDDLFPAHFVLLGCATFASRPFSFNAPVHRDP
jgi:hypothetical protein